MKRISKDRIDALKIKFKEKCCFKKPPISTEDIFKIMGYNYENAYHREFLYRWIRKWVNVTINTLWIGTPEKDDEKEIFYKAFLEKCWLEKEPFGYFIDGYFITPETYSEYEEILNNYTIRTLLGYVRSIGKMASKGMTINNRIRAEDLLIQENNVIKLLDISEKKLKRLRDRS